MKFEVQGEKKAVESVEFWLEKDKGGVVVWARFDGDHFRVAEFYPHRAVRLIRGCGDFLDTLEADDSLVAVDAD